MNTERILELADAIESHKLPKLGFNMNYWNTTPDDGDEPASSDPYYKLPDYSGHNCGSVACIGGWLEALYMSKERDWTIDDDAKLLGISVHQANALFFGYRAAPACINEITPAHAAQVLRHLAATGEVDWTVIRPEQEA